MSTLVEGPSTSIFAYESIRGRLLNIRRRKHSAPSLEDDAAGRSNKRRRDFASPEVIKRLKESGPGDQPAGIIQVEELDGKISAILWIPVSPTASESLNHLLGSKGRTTTGASTVTATAAETESATTAPVELDAEAEPTVAAESNELVSSPEDLAAATTTGEIAADGTLDTGSAGLPDITLPDAPPLATGAEVAVGAAAGILVGALAVNALSNDESSSEVVDAADLANPTEHANINGIDVKGAEEVDDSDVDEEESVGASEEHDVPLLAAGSTASVIDEDILTPRQGPEISSPYVGFTASGSDVGSSQLGLLDEEASQLLHDTSSPPPIPPKAARRSSQVSTDSQTDDDGDVKVITATTAAEVSVVEILPKDGDSDSEMDLDEDEEEVKGDVESDADADADAVVRLIPDVETQDEGVDDTKVEQVATITINGLATTDADFPMADADDTLPEVDEDEEGKKSEQSSVMEAAAVSAAVAGVAIVSTVAISPEPIPRNGARMIPERPKSFYEREAEQWEKVRVPFFVGSPTKSVVVTAEKLPVPPVPVSTTNPRAANGYGGFVPGSKRSSGVWERGPGKRASWASSFDDVFSHASGSGNHYSGEYKPGVELREEDSLMPLPTTQVQTRKGDRPKLAVSSNIPLARSATQSASSPSSPVSAGGLRRSISVITPPASQSRIKTPSSPKEEIAPLTWDARRETIMGPIGGPRPIGSTRLNGVVSRSRSASTASIGSRYSTYSTSPSSVSGFAVI
ncbi:hypothetical protein DFH27DRAFT_605439 [Peziza echinospora]|nr:hypothetical protein DFH27DRAFT_605439 [Peziza echinospora]